MAPTLKDETGPARQRRFGLRNGLLGAGAIVGLVAAFGLARLIRHVLYGVGPWDPVTVLGVPALLGCVAVVAALIPARRASRVDPVEALKYE